MKRSLVSDALSALGVHALHHQITAESLGDNESALVWYEVRELVRGLAGLHRSPLFDALLARMGAKKHSASYYMGRIAAMAAVIMAIRSQRMSRAQACKHVGSLTGTNASVLEKKMQLPSQFSSLAELNGWEHFNDVMGVLKACRWMLETKLGRKPTATEWFNDVIEIARSNTASAIDSAGRGRLINLALKAPPNPVSCEVNLICTSDAVLRIASEL